MGENGAKPHIQFLIYIACSQTICSKSNEKYTKAYEQGFEHKKLDAVVVVR
jgi:hypothetical protein